MPALPAFESKGNCRIMRSSFFTTSCTDRLNRK